jgi:hypothetical protein
MTRFGSHSINGSRPNELGANRFNDRYVATSLMSQSLKSFAKATIEKLHFVLGLISGLGVIVETVRLVLRWRGWGSLLQFAIDLNWFLGVAVVYTFIFSALGSLVMLAVIDLVVLRGAEQARKEKFMSRLLTPTMVVAGVAGILVALLARHPTIQTLQDLLGVILFRGVGLLAIYLAIATVCAWILQLRRKVATAESPNNPEAEIDKPATK